jgi:diacylglycerol kinase family enzyme
LLINPRSGSGSPSAEELEAEARRRGIDARILGRDDDPADLARNAQADALAVAGGDGSLAPIAEVALERDVPFVVVPYGTRNHFARDLDLDRDEPIKALDAFAGHERRIDVGRAGGRVFLNNVSLGLYALLVHGRERHRRRRNTFAQLRALLVLAGNRESTDLSVDGEQVEAHVALVANNAYNLDLFSIGERKRLDEGRLHLYLARGWRPRTWDERTAERLTIDAAGHRLQAAVDGEPVVLETPIDFSIERSALRVLVPHAPGGEHVGDVLEGKVGHRDLV